LRFYAGSSERLRIDSSGNVGIGTDSPNHTLDVKAATGDGISITPTAGSATNYLSWYDTGGGPYGRIGYDHSASAMTFTTVTSERMRIDSSGNLLVGMTSANGVGNTPSDVNGTEIGRGYINLNRDDSATVRHIQFGTNGVGDACLGTNGGDLYLGTEDTCLLFHNGVNLIAPVGVNAATRDGAIDLGSGANRFQDIFATNGTIQTSDENEKQQIASLTDSEINAAKAISKLFKTFKWNDAVTEKGDDARTHTGVIAQQVETAMSDAGLDASKYAFFISTTWWTKDVEVPAVEAVEAQDAVYEDVVISAIEEVLDDEGNVVTEAQPERTEQRLVSEAVEAVEAKEAHTRTDTYYTQEEAPEGATERNRKGIRYPELLSFVGAATEQRLTSVEARLDALEG